MLAPVKKALAGLSARPAENEYLKRKEHLQEATKGNEIVLKNILTFLSPPIKVKTIFSTNLIFNLLSRVAEGLAL
ncbi:hypothetical protein [Fictibacillus fluitans]|uniref:Uncharacterized protein n=1 Tax=Fictibacillus fluitans TaxID=3058422 RepID=A0ABT8I2X4_9BACL|nr:hypothetical protein [Fictibacillus sp. NE201]MDN4527379.1 hypothetical protein [Fictibacillus sp. NE201]